MSESFKSGRGGFVLGVALMMIGVVFLLDNLGVVDLVKAWPIVFIGVGVALLLKSLLKR
ncbi:hypothetical protein HOH87_07980 [bacterium]|jgi:hypothetical protein|nr:hypothetical protein [bacterium]